MESKEPHHTEAMLLSGYLNRTLSSEEEQQVTTHLKRCMSCQEELQEVTHMQTAIKTSITQRPGPSPAAFSTLMRRIEQEKQASQQQSVESTTTSWWKTVEAAFRSLFEVQWVPALASVLIVGQAFLLFSLIGTPANQQGQAPSKIVERGIPQNIPAIPVIQIQAKFVDTAKEIHIRELLKKLGGQIVNGPTTQGLYTLTFPQTEISSAQTVLATLKSNRELISTAIVLTP